MHDRACLGGLGFPLAYSKGQFSQSVTWIGGELNFNPSGITAAVKVSIVQDIVCTFNAFAKTNVVSHKDLRSFVGKANHAAGLLVVIRPFLHAIWAALSCTSSAPSNCVWI